MLFCEDPSTHLSNSLVLNEKQHMLNTLFNLEVCKQKSKLICLF